ncbi:hypothetical protein RIF29_35473 [Crotalaria pallida]|uniref:Uncharacterized protein n=1 Tax=Crotalaria pallida TaxID=3830 RepID=A0AAN9EC84_CROPI
MPPQWHKTVTAQSRSHKGTRPSPLSHSKFRTHFSVPISLSFSRRRASSHFRTHCSGSHSQFRSPRAASLWQYRRRPSPFSPVTYRLFLIEHIPDKQPHDLHHQPTVIDPKHANQIVSCLNQIAPLENLRHVKRIQKKNLEGVPFFNILFLHDMYKQAGSQFRDELQRHNLPSYLVKDINARLEGIQPKVRSSDGNSSGYNAGEIKPLNIKIE